MREVGIRALKQNASAVVAAAAQGEAIVVTDRGRPVAQLGPLAKTPLDRMIEQGKARPALRSISDLPEPLHRPGVDLTAALLAMRDEERY